MHRVDPSPGSVLLPPAPPDSTPALAAFAIFMISVMKPMSMPPTTEANGGGGDESDSGGGGVVASASASASAAAAAATAAAAAVVVVVVAGTVVHQLRGIQHGLLDAVLDQLRDEVARAEGQRKRVRHLGGRVAGGEWRVVNGG